MKSTFTVYERSLCDRCQQDVYERSYGVETITPRKYPDDWEERQQAQADKFVELTEEKRVVVVATFWDEYGGGEIEETLCECHLREALDALLNWTENA